MRFIGVILLAAHLFIATAYGDEELKDLLEPIINDHEGTVAVSIRHLESDAAYEFNGDLPLPTASLIKFPVMVALHDAIRQGQTSLERTIVLKEGDMVPGSGIITGNFSAGTQISLNDAMRLMMIHSDNTATNLVVDQIGLPATAALMEKMGYPNTKLHAKVYRRDTSIFPERSKEFGLGSTTANEMVGLLTKLHAGQLVSDDASKAMYTLMLECDDRTKIPRDLPKDTKVSHKTGAVSKSRTDAGIIESPSGPIAICILTSDNEDRSWSDDNAALVLSGRIARVTYDFFNAEQETAAGPKVLKNGATGDLVETVQRTLNARLKPSHNLGLDGDFGPATEGAVKAFQAQAKLPVTGEVDAATWAAMGELITQDAPVEAPDVVNSRKLERKPSRALDAPPRVTCKAWAIGDAATGELLWGMNEAEQLHPASTTKIMTGYLVTQVAAKDPAVLDEIVTFSERADNTVGSSARLKAGEQVPVSELLYGLMLPSGNDASVALAEHFGSRALPPGAKTTTDDDTFVQFVAAMNAMADQLGMHETHYDNTHGLTEETHLTSARDLLKLAYAAMDDEEFRRRTNTRQRGCKVVSTAGYTRNVIWNNTNRLLKIEGYDGVKTGTTSAAGCCLVSRGHHEGRGLIVVVLGASTSDSRYIDSENLYQWAWNRLADD